MIAKWKMTFRKRIIHLLIKEKTYKSYQEAALRCQKELYEQAPIVHLVTKRARQFRNKLSVNGTPCHIGNVGALCILDAINRLTTAHQSGPITVLDFGGGDGSYYWQVRKSLPDNILLRWCVVETPAMATAMKTFATDELCFASSIPESMQKAAGRIDIVFSSGAIQYTENPWKALADLFAVEATYIIFNRQSLSLEDFDIISIQRSLLSWHSEGPVPEGFKDRLIKYPHTSIRLSTFEKKLKEKYKILYTFPESTGIKHVNKLKVTGISYLLQKA